MNMKNFCSLILVFLCVVFAGCGKKRKHQLAQNYYQLAQLSLQEQLTDARAFSDALHYIDLAIVADPQPIYHAQRGTILLQGGHLEDARVCFESLLAQSLVPALKNEIRNNYACLLARLGRTAEAAALWAALINDPHYETPEAALLNYSKIRVLDGDFEGAREYLNRAIRIDPNYTDAHYHLAALAHYHLHDDALARKELTTVLFLDATHGLASKLAEAVGVCIDRSAAWTA